MKLDDNLVHYLWAKEHPLRHESIIKEIEDERGLNYLDEFEVKHMFSVLPAMKDRRVSAETLTSLRVNINFAHVEKPVGTMIRILKSPHFINAIMDPEAAGLHIFIARACAVNPSLAFAPISDFAPYKEESAALDKMVADLYEELGPKLALRDANRKAITDLCPTEEFAGSKPTHVYLTLIDSLYAQVDATQMSTPEATENAKKQAIVAALRSESFFESYDHLIASRNLSYAAVVKTALSFIGEKDVNKSHLEKQAAFYQLVINQLGSYDSEKVKVPSHVILERASRANSSERDTRHQEYNKRYDEIQRQRQAERDADRKEIADFCLTEEFAGSLPANDYESLIDYLCENMSTMGDWGGIADRAQDRRIRQQAILTILKSPLFFAAYDHLMGQPVDDRVGMIAVVQTAISNLGKENTNKAAVKKNAALHPSEVNYGGGGNSDKSLDPGVREVMARINAFDVLKKAGQAPETNHARERE